MKATNLQRDVLLPPQVSSGGTMPPPGFPLLCNFIRLRESRLPNEMPHMIFSLNYLNNPRMEKHLSNLRPKIDLSA